MNRSINLLWTLAFMLSIASSASAQLRGHCGMSYHDEQHLPRYSAFEVKAWKEANPDRYAEINIPITFHLVAGFDGEGRLGRKFVLNTLERLNKDYAPYGIQFYFKDDGFNEIDNDGIHFNPSENQANIVSNKEGSSVDIFVTDNADTPNGIGTTLGYYSPVGDYIVIRKKDVQDSSNTLSHEVGHYFSLRHPHSGWADAYDKAEFGDTVPFFTTPIVGATIELVNGSNCATAADGLCDTPPDYLMGFTSGNCLDDQGVWDPLADKMISNAKLSMGYFSECAKYEFSPEQIVRFKMNYESSARDFLRSNYVPTAESISDPVVFTSPSVPGQKFDEYNGISLSWESVEHAELYLLEIKETAANGELYEYTLTEPATYITNLSPNKKYFITVKAYNEISASVTAISAIETGSEFTSTQDPSFVDKFEVYPNPTLANTNINISMDADFTGLGELSLTDITGKVVYNQGHKFVKGAQTLVIEQSANFNSGVYILKLNTELGTVTRKVIIQ